MPPPAVPPSIAAAAGHASLPAIASSIEGLASFGDVLADFLDQWNRLLLDANTIAAALPPLADADTDPDPNPKLSPFVDPAALLAQSNPVLAAAAALATPLADSVAEESNPKSPVRAADRRQPSPVPAPEDPLHQRNASVLFPAVSAAAACFPVPAAADGFPVADPVPAAADGFPVANPVPAAADGFPVANPVPDLDSNPLLMAEALPVRAPEPAPKPNPVPDRERRAGEPSEAALRSICEQMGSRSLRGFVTAHLLDRAWLRRVGPAALRRAPDPGALVLRAVSRHYICAESDAAEAACVLILDLYVRAGCPRRPHKEAEQRAEARVEALSWRSRIMRDKGKVAKASARDARGLILLMAAFGVPAELPLKELYQLLLAGDCLDCIDLLKCSQLLMKKLRDVVADMLNNGSYHEAIGMIIAFEMQEAFPLADVLAYIVEKLVHDREKLESGGQFDLAGLRKHDEEELLLWRSISKYVEEHTPSFSEISCPSFAERIKVLEERIAKPNQAFLSEESCEPSFSDRREPNQASLMI